jgi:alkylated DNA repair dioxygenase AlkB
MFVVRGGMPNDWVEVLEQSVPRTIEDVDAVFGSNQSLVGSSKSRFYKTWQAVGVGCSCRYKYDSTNSHPVFKVGAGGETGDPTSWWKKQQPQSVSRCLDIVLNLWNRFGTDKCSPDMFNLFVVNHYSFPKDSIPWHDDDSKLLHAGRDDFSADIASITLQNSGILCFMPRKDGPLWQQYRCGKYSTTVDNLIALKMRAAVALHRGDILLFTGNFQRLMQHKAPSFDKVAWAEGRRVHAALPWA